MFLNVVALVTFQPEMPETYWSALAPSNMLSKVATLEVVQPEKLSSCLMELAFLNIDDRFVSAGVFQSTVPESLFVPLPSTVQPSNMRAMLCTYCVSKPEPSKLRSAVWLLNQSDRSMGASLPVVVTYLMLVA